jgi:hypothetical protein
MEPRKAETEYQKIKALEQKVSVALQLKQEIKNNSMLFDETDVQHVDECIEECQTEYNEEVQKLSKFHQALVYAINFADVVAKREKILQQFVLPTEKLRAYFQQKTFLIALLAKEMAEIGEIKNEGMVPL